MVKAHNVEVIQSLDRPFVANGQTYTLRDMILDIPFPLDFTTTTPYRLFNSVDFASKGKDKSQGFVYFTTYKDCKDVAKGVVAALPAYVRHQLGDEAVKTWFASTEIGRDIELGLTLDGHWDGTWATQEDQILSNILDADVGFQIDNIDLLAQDEEEDEDARRVLLNADDASYQSFGTALFGRAGPAGEVGLPPNPPQAARTGPDPSGRDQATAHDQAGVSGGSAA
jgi:hypothetical protein